MKQYLLLTTACMAILTLSSCSDSKTQTQSKNTMKCGPGKCGANMVSGDGMLAKKQRNILSQMREGDLRKGCVRNAKTTRALYDCVRDPQTGRLSKKCGNDTKSGDMKCGGGMKCGGDMKCGG